MAIDSIGGEGDATKWTKYDNAVQSYKAEQKKRGVPMSTWDPDGKVYCDTLHNAKDPFSRDLNNTYELDGLDMMLCTSTSNIEDTKFFFKLLYCFYLKQFDVISVSFNLF